MLRRSKPALTRPKQVPGRAAKRQKRAPYCAPLSVSHRTLLVEGNDEAFREIIYHMLLAFGRLEGCRDFFGRMIGLTGSQFSVLIGTAHHQGSQGVTIRTLSKHVQLASTHVTTEVGRLMAKGLLKKQPNGDDARSVLVSLTARGERAVARLAPVLREVNDVLFQDVRREDFLALGQFLDRFTRNTERALVLMDAYRVK
jgi:DNA-binding MarR family transcriptional regulator